MNKIQIKDINLGGIADSQFQGLANSVYASVGLDIHSEPGIIKVNQKLTKESGVLIDDLVKVILPCSDGNTYLFGSTNGKIWKRTSGGTYSLEATASPAAGSAGILDAKEYQGYIYYGMQSRLGRVQVGAPTDWTSRSDDWKTFTKTDSEFHPMEEQNQVLYIGDGYLLAQVDAGVFSADALDIDIKYRIKCLGNYFTDILLGTFVTAYRVLSEIFRWNTWSIDSYQSSDPVPEVGINSFLHTDNAILVSCGRKGNVYSYNGGQLEQYKRIPGDWLGTKEAVIHPNASCNKNGLPLLGLSNISGDPAKEGVYSFGGYSSNYNKVLNLENLISNGRYAGVDIGAIEMCGTQELVAWKTSGTITMTIASPCIVTWTAHGQVDGTPIMFTTTGALPTGITASTYYYLKSIDANTFHLYDTEAHALAGGATGRVITTGTQSGTHTCANYGIDKEDSTAKVASAYFETRIINVAREDKKVLNGYIGYRTLPSGCTVKVYYKTNYATSYTEASSTADVDRKIVEINESLPEASTIQIKVELNASGNDSPEVDLSEFRFE